jgi:hypothetical protein
MEYKASKDMTVKIVTMAAILLLGFFSYKSVIGLIQSKGNLTPILIHSGVLILLVGTLLLCFLYAPLKYSVDDNKLIIHRPIANKYFLIDSITEIRLVDKSELKGMIRTFGVGGLFGNYGKFYNQALGNITLYATQNKNYLLVVVGKKKIMITPDDIGIMEQIKVKNQPVYNKE